ncbi:MAG TPA: PDZ domain-containing protein [Pyrinomonadaceae bacterium]
MATSFHKLSLSLALLACACLHAQAQQTAPPPVASTSAPLPATQTNTPAPVTAPQVNSVIHRLSGFQMLTLLRRSNARVAPLDDELLMAEDMHTSITAGLFLEDGQIVARLPQAELEIPAMLTKFYAPATAPKPPEPAANLFIIERDGQQLTARFIGLDGGTGLSLLSVEGLRTPPPARDAKEETLTVGQRIRLLSPARATKAETLTSDQFFLNMGEMTGRLTEIARATSGNVTRLTVRAEELSQAIVGGVALNDAGETIGIVESSSASEARLIPVAAVRRAVTRIRARLESKPQPWLGARGAALAGVSPEQLINVGWKPAEASRLTGQRTGVVLTSVPPQTPAWFANLRAGDVVTRVGAGEVRSADDFSSLLKQAGRQPVRFTVLAPNRPTPRVVTVKLSESLNPVLEMEAAEERAARLASTDPLVARGLETLAITTKLAAYLKARGGLLVVFVHPESAAARAGLMPGDVIESVNGQLLTENNLPAALPMKAALNVVRNGQQMEVNLLAEDVKQR